MLTNTGNGTTSYAFTGEWQDGTSLIHLRARYYSVDIGRFISKDNVPGDNTRPLTLNGWGYVEGNPINRVDPTGEFSLPRLPGVCIAPPIGEVGNPSATEALIRNDGRSDHVYIYCGEFKLTAYQFADNVGYPEDWTRSTSINAPSVTLSEAFILDAQLNGTGHSNSICPTTDGYFTIPRGTVNTGAHTFEYYCGKGKAFSPLPYTQGGDAYQVVAADQSLLPSGTKLYAPEMEWCRSCAQGYPSAYFNAHFVVRDAGDAIQRYRLDIFAGQGGGVRSRQYGSSPAALWLKATEFLGITRTFDNRSANGPTPIYQMAPQAWEQVYRNLLCDVYPEPIIGPY